MPETFDPPQGGPACVAALREVDVKISQRLGARLHALGRRGIQFSLALLEGAEPGTPLEGLLLDARWNQVQEPSEAAALLAAHDPHLACVKENGTLKIVSGDEVDEAAESAPSLLPALLGEPLHAQGALWSQDRLEEAALTFLASEDTAALVEKLRYLFRATQAAGRDPVPLLITALQRPRLALEVASLARQNLDRDLGRALEDLYDEELDRRRDAIFYLMAQQADGRHGSASALAVPALTAALAHHKDPETARAISEHLGSAVVLATDNPEIMEPFLDALLDALDVLEVTERVAVSRYLIAIQGRFPRIVDFLFRRMRATADPQMQAFYGNVLARAALDAAQGRALISFLVDLFVAHGQDTALQERLKSTFLHLGAEPLALLTARAAEMSPLQRSWLADLWAVSTATPDERLLAEFAIGEIGARNRAVIISMLRSRLLHRPSIATFLAENEWAGPAITQVLLEEGVRLEDPDDVALFDFLAGLATAAVDAAFERAREEAALDSRGAPYRLRVFAHLAARAGTDSEKVELALAFPFLQRGDLPASIDALGALGRVSGLAPEIVEEILGRIFERLDAYPQERLAAALHLHEGADEALQDRIEARFEEILADEAVPHRVLEATLRALDRLLDREAPPRRVEPMSILLARIVFKKSREMSLEHVMQDMLKEESEGVGIRALEAWSKDDRDHALVILGKAAAHPQIAESLHNMIAARLAGFLDDWLDAQERGQNLYQHRDTPLFAVLGEVVDRRPSEHAVEAVVRLGLRALEVHRKAPQRFGLERREEAQRLIARLITLAPQEPVEVRGSMRLDIPQTALQTLMTLATRENPTAARILEEISPRIPERLQPRLQAFLAFQRRAAK